MHPSAVQPRLDMFHSLLTDSDLCVCPDKAVANEIATVKRGHCECNTVVTAESVSLCFQKEVIKALLCTSQRTTTGTVIFRLGFI